MPVDKKQNQANRRSDNKNKHAYKIDSNVALNRERTITEMQAPDSWPDAPKNESKPPKSNNSKSD